MVTVLPNATCCELSSNKPRFVIPDENYRCPSPYKDKTGKSFLVRLPSDSNFRLFSAFYSAETSVIAKDRQLQEGFVTRLVRPPIKPAPPLH